MESTADSRNLEVASLPAPGSDEELVMQLAAGDAAAFDQIFDRYHKQIYNFIRKQVSERENIEDLVQEVFLRVFKSSKNFDPSKKFSSWVYKIALNEVKRHWKKSAAKQTFSLNTPVGDEGSESERQDFIEDFRDLPENVLERENFSETLKVLIDRLPEKQRTVVILKIYHELTFEEIAEICECPLSTVLSRMRYAVNKLRRWLGVEED
ncbi:MAG: sigma-70 family RNA polymerase sigma factor [bacterium]